MAMYIDKITVQPNLQSLEPELSFHINYSYPDSESLLVGFHGLLIIDNMKIAQMYSDEPDTERFHFMSLREPNNVQTFKGNDYFRLTSPLSRRALEKIEESREKHPKKDVDLKIVLTTRFIKSKAVKTRIQLNDKSTVTIPNLSDNPLLLVEQTTDNYHSVTIPSNSWLLEFSPKFGLGRYRVIELPIIEEIYGDEQFQKRFNRALEHFSMMEKHFRDTEWDLVIKESRQLWELLNDVDIASIIENQDEDPELTKAFKELIDSFFKLCHKFVHPLSKDKKKLMIKPIAFKEDAMLSYTISASTLNLISCRLKRLEHLSK